MKKIRIILSLALGMLVAFNLVAADDVEVQYIAIHFGDPANAEVLNQGEFPAFQFYNAEGEVIGYTEDQKLIGNPNYLKGWYGEVPEKMGFSATYRGELSKSEGFPYDKGAVYVLDKNGTVAYQLPPERFNEENYPDKYQAVYNDLRSTIRKMSRGKEEKVVKEKKREYVKSSPVGELEATKGSKTDKGDGILGWPVPSLTLTDGDGNSVKLDELAKGKVTVLVFYTMNGATWKRGDTDGNIKAEKKGEKLVSGKSYQDSQGEEFNKKAEEGDLKGMIGMAVSESTASDDSRGKIYECEELTDRDKAGAYINFTQHLRMAQSLAK
ncbi:MAG: hypothetical protein K9J30_06140 [Bacteroidales bacterium]|nr:hypothetical protein [Bacteroidales bacterium]